MLLSSALDMLLWFNSASQGLSFSTWCFPRSLFRFRKAVKTMQSNFKHNTKQNYKNIVLLGGLFRPCMLQVVLADGAPSSSRPAIAVRLHPCCDCSAVSCLAWRSFNLANDRAASKWNHASFPDSAISVKHLWVRLELFPFCFRWRGGHHDARRWKTRSANPNTALKYRTKRMRVWRVDPAEYRHICFCLDT